MPSSVSGKAFFSTHVMFQKTVNKHQKGMKIDREVKSADECNTKYSELNFLKGFCVVKAITSFLGKPAPVPLQPRI